jgi:hypothetical protein
MLRWNPPFSPVFSPAGGGGVGFVVVEIGQFSFKRIVSKDNV